jgi:hypothetical protein
MPSGKQTMGKLKLGLGMGRIIIVLEKVSLWQPDPFSTVIETE